MSFSSLGTPPPTIEIYPPWPHIYLIVIERAIATAWTKVKQNKTSIIQTEDEDTITNELKTVLVDLWRNKTINGFSCKQFAIPTRDSKLPDFQGKSIDKMPDLTFYPAAPSIIVSDVQHDALFFECKVLNKNKGMYEYANNGIKRFIEGKYAWKMKHGGMIAYDFKCNGSPQNMLNSYLYGKSKKQSNKKNSHVYNCLGTPKECYEALPTPHKNRVAITTHKRPIMGNTVDTEITLRHLWLQS